MTKAELLAAISAFGLVAIHVDEKDKNDDLEALLDTLNASKTAAERAAIIDEQAAKIVVLEEALKDLEKTIDENIQSQLAEKDALIEELNKSLAAAEASKTITIGDKVVAEVEFEVEGETIKEKYIINSGVNAVVNGEPVNLTKEELAKNQEALKHLVAIESGIITKIEA